MLKIIQKIGGYDKAYDVLKNEGVLKNKSSLFIQSYRGQMSSKASLVLWDYCLKNNIPVSMEDFKEKRTNQNEREEQ